MSNSATTKGVLQFRNCASGREVEVSMSDTPESVEFCGFNTQINGWHAHTMFGVACAISEESLRLYIINVMADNGWEEVGGL